MAGNVQNLDIGPCWAKWTPGGTLAERATLTVQGITVTARQPGIAGNSVQIVLIDPSGASQELSVSVSSSAVNVSLATDGTGEITSTASEIVAAINADEEASALVVASGTGSSAVDAVAATSLTGGVDATGTERDLGYTKGGISVKVATETYEMEVDQEDGVVGEKITKRTIEANVPLAEYTMDNVLLAFPGAELVTDAADLSKQKVVLKSASGVDTATLEGVLRLHPTDKADDDFSEDFVFPNAMPTGEFEISYDKKSEKIINVKFKPKPVNKIFGIFGDPNALA